MSYQRINFDSPNNNITQLQLQIIDMKYKLSKESEVTSRANANLTKMNVTG